MDVHGKIDYCKNTIMEMIDRTEADIINKLNTEIKVIGLKQVIRECDEGNIKSVIIAKDIDRYTMSKIINAIQGAAVEINYIDSKERLGKLAGINIAAAVVGIIKSIDKR